MNDNDNSAKCMGTISGYNHPAFETKAFIFGVEASNVSDVEIFKHIAGLEAQIKSLQGIENKPKKLTARITELQKQINSLIAYCDER